MTYKLEPVVEKIEAPVTVLLPDGTKRHYKNGMAAASATFVRHYIIEKISAVGDVIILTLKEVEAPATGWIGEEKQSFF